jgi:hypothetical protein
MKKSQLRKIIREEIKKLNENDLDKINKILDKFSNKITKNKYPASIAADILVNRYNIDYEIAKSAFFDWAQSNGILANMENF